MPNTPPDHIREFLEQLRQATPEDLAAAFREQGKEELEMGRWPIIEHVTPKEPVSRTERMQVESTIGRILYQMRLSIMMTTPEMIEFIRDDNESFMALTQVYLINAETLEQAGRLLEGYFSTQLQHEIEKHFTIAIETPGGLITTNRETAQDAVIKEMGQRWDSLKDHARNRHWHVFANALSPKELETYGTRNGSYDGVLSLLADPAKVYIRQIEKGQQLEPRLVDREIPFKKRMTPEKMARFTQLPGLQEDIEEDVYSPKIGAISSTLDIIAEYFCENDDVLRKNGVTEQDVNKWLKEKFEKYKPPLEVAWYVWARLQGTRFEQVSMFIEQYIMDVHEKEHPWLFELGGIERKRLTEIGSLFTLYQGLISFCKGKPEFTDRYKEIVELLPSIDLLQTVISSKVYADLTQLGNLLRHYKHSTTDFCNDYTEEQLEADICLFAIRILNEHVQIPEKWEGYEGFELLDPIKIKLCAQTNRMAGIQTWLNKAIERLKIIPLTEVKKFKATVMDQLPPADKENFAKVVDEIIDQRAAQVIFESVEPQRVVDVARGRSDLGRDVNRIILPGGITYGELTGNRPVTSERLSPMAERALLERHFGNVRGGQQIANYLMAHVGSMRPSELILPSEGSPNREIIREHGDSPDLLSLTQMATILGYLGYGPDEIMAETNILAQMSAEESRPELTTVGTELEQIGATPEGQIVTDRFAWLFNVLPMGNDVKANEVMTAPTSSAAMQGVTFSAITDGRFRFVNPDRLWEATERKDRSPSSIHMTTALPNDLPFTPDMTIKFFEPLQQIQWIAQGGSKNLHRITQGRVAPWFGHSLLDVYQNKHRRQRVEFRNLRLEQDGSHLRNIQQLQVVASAGIQYMREKAGLQLTPSGRVMAQIYERFIHEAQVVTRNPDDQNSAAAALAILERFAREVESELNIVRKPKTEGIIQI